MRINPVTITRTTAMHTALICNVIPVDLAHITHRLAIIWADYTVMVIAITKPRNAEMRTTEIAHALGHIRLLTILEHAQTLARITTSESDVVSIIRALVLTITRTASATSIVRRVLS